MTYQLISGNTVLRVEDGAFIPLDPANTDYQAFLAWQEDGGTIDDLPALPADN